MSPDSPTTRGQSGLLLYTCDGTLTIGWFPSGGPAGGGHACVGYIRASRYVGGVEATPCGGLGVDGASVGVGCRRTCWGCRESLRRRGEGERRWCIGRCGPSSKRRSRFPEGAGLGWVLRFPVPPPALGGCWRHLSLLDLGTGWGAFRWGARPGKACRASTRGPGLLGLFCRRRLGGWEVCCVYM